MRGARHTESVSCLLRQTPCLCLAQEAAPSRCFLLLLNEYLVYLDLQGSWHLVDAQKTFRA